MNYVSHMMTEQKFRVKDVARFKEELDTLLRLPGCPFSKKMDSWSDGLTIVLENDEGDVWVGGTDTSLELDWDELPYLIEQGPPADWDPVTEQPGYEEVTGIPRWLKDCAFCSADTKKPSEMFDVIAFLQRHIVEEGEGSVGIIFEVGNEGLRGGHAYICLFTHDNCIYKNHRDLRMLAEMELDEDREKAVEPCQGDKHGKKSGPACRGHFTF